MILQNMSERPIGATAESETSDGKSTSSVAIGTYDDVVKSTTSEMKSAPPCTTVNAINSNTFVVKLKPSPGNRGATVIPKTNLLQLFRESGNVKALGIRRIVVNRNLLKNAKSRTKAPVDSSSTTIKLNTGASNAPIFIRCHPQPTTLNGKENKSQDSNKKDDEISGNLEKFMNFTLAGLVPTPIKSELDANNSFEVKLPQMKEIMKQSKATQIRGNLPLPSKVPDEKSKSDTCADDELTSLSWLMGNDKSLLKTIRSCNPDDAGISMSGDETDEDEESDAGSNRLNAAVFTAKSKVDCGSQGGFGTRQYGQSYSPNGKPPYSFSCLIFMAVEDSQEKMLPVKEIYSWVCKHFTYFTTAPSGWKNSIRHNLSLNKCFKKVDQGKHSHDPGKGSLWGIDPAYRPNLIQALKRTPFYPYLYPSGIGQPLSLNNLASLLPGAKSGRIPLWSPSMSQSGNSAWADPDVASAALNLMGLKGSDAIDKQSPSVRSTLEELTAEIFSKSNGNDDVMGTIPLIISNPADDHTYSSAPFATSKGEEDRCPSPDSDKSAPDAAYEFETCGTDLESDEEATEHLSNHDSENSECGLGDSGFSSLRGRKRKRKSKSPPDKKKGKSQPPRGEKAKRHKPSTRSLSKSNRTPPKQGLKVRFQPKKKPKVASTPSKVVRRKISPVEEEEGLTSDGDSGKDSPKVASKTRRRVKSPDVVVKKKQKTIPNIVHTSPYGTRSATQTRHSRRIVAAEQKGNVVERASARKRRQDSVSTDWEEEEIKLAAGSLLHLAGFRSPPSALTSNV